MTTLPAAPVAITETSGGQLIIGAILSNTLMKAVVVEEFPFTSEAVKVTGIECPTSTVEATLVSTPVKVPLLAMVNGVISTIELLAIGSSNL